MSFQTVLRTDPFLKNLSFDYNNYHIMLGNKSLLMITPSEIVNLLFSALRLKASHMRRLSPNHLVSDLGFVRLKAPELPFSSGHFTRYYRIFRPSFDPSIQGSTKTKARTVKLLQWQARVQARPCKAETVSYNDGSGRLPSFGSFR